MSREARLDVDGLIRVVQSRLDSGALTFDIVSELTSLGLGRDEAEAFVRPVNEGKLDSGWRSRRTLSHMFWGFLWVALSAPFLLLAVTSQGAHDGALYRALYFSGVGLLYGIYRFGEGDVVLVGASIDEVEPTNRRALSRTNAFGDDAKGLTPSVIVLGF